MPTTRETILTALHTRLSALPATILRGEVLPERVPAAGLLILRDGEPGEPEVTLSPLRYHYQHRAEIEAVVQGASRDTGFDTLCASIGAALAAISFTDARSILTGLFRGFSLAPAIVAAGFGCWMYIYVAWPRFAAQFHGGDTFSDLIRFYARAAVALILFLFVARFARLVLGDTVSGLLLCVSGGAAAAAAFQTVMAFVPPGSSNEGAPKT